MSQIIFMCFSFSVINSLYLDIWPLSLRVKRPQSSGTANLGGTNPGMDLCQWGHVFDNISPQVINPNFKCI